LLKTEKEHGLQRERMEEVKWTGRKSSTIKRKKLGKRALETNKKGFGVVC